MIDMSPEELVELLFKKVEEKIDELGGKEKFIQAIVWKWWMDAPINDGDDFDEELNKCKQAYKEIQEHLDMWNFFGGEDEDTFNLPS